MNKETLTMNEPNEQEPEAAEVARTPPAWLKQHSLPVTVGCAAILGAIAVGCHVLLGGTLGCDDAVQEMEK